MFHLTKILERRQQENIKKETADERAYRLIVDSLIDGYKPGDFLYECALAKKFNMSRTPIALALNALVNEGLLNKLPKKGCQIPRLSIEDAHEVFCTRRALEMEAIRGIVFQKKPEVLERIQENIEAQIVATRNDDFDCFYILDLEFHRLLVSCVKNKYLYNAWNRVFIRCNIYTNYFLDVFRQHQLIAQNLLHGHTEIVDAIKDGHEELAIKNIYRHFDHIAMYAIDHTMIYDMSE